MHGARTPAAEPTLAHRTRLSLIGSLSSARLFAGHSTPVLKKISCSNDLVAEIEEDLGSDLFHDLTSNSWTLHRVGIMFNFNPRHLDELAASLQEELPRGHLVQVAHVSGVRGNREDAQPLRITIAKEACPTLQLLRAYIMSVDAAEVDFYSDVTILPVMLTCGKHQLVRVVSVVLMKLFDCVVAPMQLGHEDLEWMAAMWSGFGALGEDEARPSTIALTYGLPRVEALNDRLNCFHVTLDGAAVRQLWQRIVLDEQDDFSEDQKTRFFGALHHHLQCKMGIRFDYLRLISISLPILSAKACGQIQMLQASKVKTVLRFLTRLAQGDLLTSRPKLADELTLVATYDSIERGGNLD